MPEATTLEALTCNVNECGGAMVMRRSGGAAVFDCQRCKQTVTLYPGGQMSQLILPRLYPSDPSHWKPAMHHEWVDYEIGQRLFSLTASEIAGFTTSPRAAEIRADLARAATEYKAAHPLPDPTVSRSSSPGTPRRRWWRFW